MANVLILMGVSGSGKTTVGRLLAARLGWQFVDADDYHSAVNIDKMRQGLSLTDCDRSPWLDALNAAMQQWICRGQPTILACSALKADYRQRLTQGIHPIHWVYLQGSVALLRSRLAARVDHFMPLSLLRSQLDALEAPPDALVVNIASPPEILVEEIISCLGLSI